MSGWTWECPCGFSLHEYELEKARYRQKKHRLRHLQKLEEIRNPLKETWGSETEACGRGVCALGSGHIGPCRV